MFSRIRSAGPVIIGVFVLSAIAAASFYAMDFFERSIFDSSRPLQFSFALLAISLCFAYLSRKPWLTLLVCAGAAIGMWFYTPIYAGLFFPVVLQAVLYDAAKEQTKRGVLTFAAALLCNVGALCLWFYCLRYDGFRKEDLARFGLSARICVFLALSAAVLGFYVFLVVRQRKEWQRIKGAGEKTKNEKISTVKRRELQKTAARRKKNGAAAFRSLLAFLFCAVNLLAQGVYGVLMLTEEYYLAFFCAQLLFLLFLECRKDPMLHLHEKVGSFLSAALQPDD